MPHLGDWRHAKVPRIAYEYAFPLTVSNGGKEASLMELSPENLVLEASRCSRRRSTGPAS
ncbi:MAG: hypothetical protein JCHSAcid_09680 [uncultured Acidilobus sp. JCHS]|jgi:hypothetical protein|nr:MAG: hypothetical protein JCHSAcid_09680 [uncultured Acidilobus sp. JCHS]